MRTCTVHGTFRQIHVVEMFELYMYMYIAVRSTCTEQTHNNILRHYYRLSFRRWWRREELRTELTTTLGPSASTTRGQTCQHSRSSLSRREARRWLRHTLLQNNVIRTLLMASWMILPDFYPNMYMYVQPLCTCTFKFHPFIGILWCMECVFPRHRALSLSHLHEDNSNKARLL